MSDYLAKKEVPNATEARLGEKADESREKDKKKNHKGEDSLDPKSSNKRESEELGSDPSKQKVITFEQLQANKKKSQAFEADTETGEQQQEIS